jgi:hypothetical protein
MYEKGNLAYCAKTLMARAVCFSVPLCTPPICAAHFPENSGWAEGSRVTFRRFQEAVLWVVAIPASINALQREARSLEPNTSTARTRNGTTTAAARLINSPDDTTTDVRAGNFETTGACVPSAGPAVVHADTAAWQPATAVRNSRAANQTRAGAIAKSYSEDKEEVVEEPHGARSQARRRKDARRAAFKKKLSAARKAAAHAAALVVMLTTTMTAAAAASAATTCNGVAQSGAPMGREWQKTHLRRLLLHVQSPQTGASCQEARDFYFSGSSNLFENRPVPGHRQHEFSSRKSRCISSKGMGRNNVTKGMVLTPFLAFQ